MTTNQKFENEARFRSRLAMLITIVIYLSAIGFIWFFNGNELDILSKIKADDQQTELKP